MWPATTPAVDKGHTRPSHMAVRQRVQALERALKESAAIDDLIDFSASMSAARTGLKICQLVCSASGTSLSDLLLFLARRSCKVADDEFDDDADFDIFNDASPYPTAPRPLSAKEPVPLAVPLSMSFEPNTLIWIGLL